MGFKLWLEAKLDQSIFKPKYYDYSGKKHLNHSFSLKINDQGHISEIEDMNAPHITINPGAKSIDCQRLSPQSSEFRKIIIALKQSYPDIVNWDVHYFYMAGHMKTGNNKWDRTAGYWLKNSVDFDNKIPKFLYHGTSTNQWYDGIKKKGLLPRSLSGSAGSYGAQNIGALSQHDLVYLSTHPDAAAREAAIQAAHKHGGRPMILKVFTSGLFPEKFTPDEDSHESSIKKSIIKMSTLGYKGKVPPQAIIPFLIGQQKIENNRINYYWERFKDVEISEHPLMNRLNTAVGEPTHLDTNSPEHYALLDAGVIEKQETTNQNGFRNINYIKVKDISDEELKKILKNSYWTQNVRAIINDLNSGYNGAIIPLKSINYNDSMKNDEIIKMLINSGVVNIQKSGEYTYFDVYTWNIEPKAIKLAKMMGKMSFSEFANHIKELIRNNLK